MDNLALILNPLSKLKIYKSVRSIVLKKMDNNEILPDRAMQIITYTKEHIVQVESAQMAITFCEDLSVRFTELKNLIDLFDRESLEQYDRVITKIVDMFMEKNDMDQVDSLLSEMGENNSKEEKEYLMADLKKRHSDEFDKAVTFIAQSNKK